MKPIIFLISGLVTSIVTLQSFWGNNVNHQTPLFFTDTTGNYLKLYGQYVFYREKCNNCHTLNQTQDTNLVSLDGLKNKYLKAWHYMHLTEPTSVVLNSTMPSFTFLTERTFTKDSIDMNIGAITNKHWCQQVSEARMIQSELNKIGIDVLENSDIIALISFIDNIPESEELKIVRKDENEMRIKKQRIMDSLWSKTRKAIDETINDKYSAREGEKIFLQYCTQCHGKKAEGVIGPNLTDDYWLHGGTNSNIAKTIIYGVPERGMVAWRYQLEPNEVGQLVSYIKSLKGTNPPNAKMKQGKQE